MSRNLRSKISDIVNDAYDLRRESVITKLENLFKEELEMREAERDLTYNDLVMVQNMAVKEFMDLVVSEEKLGRLVHDQAMMKTLCNVQAVVGFMRGKGFTATNLRYKK